MTPLLEKTAERIFVIISDALRYEAGVELFDKLRRRLNAEVTLEPMQATLPSYTQLGMAALLPGEVTGIDEQGTVYVEELPATSVNKREKILQQAVPMEQLFAWMIGSSWARKKGCKRFGGGG
ncbi:PglZ domain-containing protein [Kroppenstedtia sanguinis]|uniref:PglZ domain-containing protein n=1 Tax=Kroppenstedtia sanguinis TaxID=1380684 RepID=A0ABW4C6K4_9BACL